MTHNNIPGLAEFRAGVSAAMRASESGLQLQAAIARKGNDLAALEKYLATANQKGWVKAAAFIERIMMA